MYVCLCHAISDRQIRDVVSRGAESLPEVQVHLPVANCCGCCADAARQIIDSQLTSGRHPVAA